MLGALYIRSEQELCSNSLEDTNGTQPLENVTDPSVCTTAASLGSPPPTLSHHTQESVGASELPRSESPDVGLSATEGERESQESVGAPELSRSESPAAGEREFEQAISLAPPTAPQNTDMQSYAHYVARAIEIILNECPKDKQMLCGQQILTAALRIQMKMKNRSACNSPPI